VREFARETSHELADWDGKIPATLKTLFTQPGVLTIDALAGRRMRWLTPLRVYLLCSVAFFACKPVLESVTGRSPRQSIRLTTDGTPGTPLSAAELQRIREGLPARVFGADRVERIAVGRADVSRQINSALQQSMFVLLPLFALLTRIVWRKQLPYFSGHLIAAFHFQAAVFGVLTVYWMIATLVPSDAVAVVANTVALAYIGWYGLTAYRRIFRDSWPTMIIKAALVLVPYFFFFVLTGLVILGYTVWRM